MYVGIRLFAHIDVHSATFKYAPQMGARVETSETSDTLLSHISVFSGACTSMVCDRLAGIELPWVAHSHSAYRLVMAYFTKESDRIAGSHTRPSALVHKRKHLHNASRTLPALPVVLLHRDRGVIAVPTLAKASRICS